LLCSDRCTILERIEFIVERGKKETDREREKTSLPEEVEEVKNTARNIGIMRV
jgi:hypothetical protein